MFLPLHKTRFFGRGLGYSATFGGGGGGLSTFEAVEGGAGAGAGTEALEPGREFSGEDGRGRGPGGARESFGGGRGASVLSWGCGSGPWRLDRLRTSLLASASKRTSALRSASLISGTAGGVGSANREAIIFSMVSRPFWPNCAQKSACFKVRLLLRDL
ncbi:hypothetical protein BC567DRAFT_229403 [Phyllosticta citribraziliensis]